MSATLQRSSPATLPVWADRRASPVSLDRVAGLLVRLCAIFPLLLTGGVLFGLLAGLWTTATHRHREAILFLLPGTLQVALIALGLALPLGTLAALALRELAPPDARRLLLPPLHLLSAVPAVLWGVLALTVLTPTFLRPLLPGIADHNLLSAGLLLGLMLLPGVITLSLRALDSVPEALREGAAALGADPLVTLRHVVLPEAGAGLLSVAILTLARAIGEPLIVALAATPLPATALTLPAATGAFQAPTATLASWILIAPAEDIWGVALLLFACTGALTLLGVRGGRLPA